MESTMMCIEASIRYNDAADEGITFFDKDLAIDWFEKCAFNSALFDKYIKITHNI